MKKLFTLLLCIISLSVTAQTCYECLLTFDPGDTLTPNQFYIDTTYTHNNWQIGHPNKTVFTSAFSNPNALVTDTLHPYTPNDTSVAILHFVNFWETQQQWGSVFILSFFQKLDIDTSDKWLIEYSTDSGQHWTDLKHPLSSLSFYVDSTAIGWPQVFIIFPQMWFAYFDYQVRFKFISGNNQGNKDGWMIDDLHLQYMTEGVKSVYNNNAINIYPNPTTGLLHINPKTTDAKQATITIYDITGRKVYEAANFPPSNILDLPLPSGQYLLKYTTAKEAAMKRFVIAK